MTVQPPEPVDSADDSALTWASFVVWSLVALVAAMLSVTLVPLVVGTVTVPIGLIIVVVANIALPRVFAQQIGVRGGAVVPGLIWLVVALAASIATSERDLILPSNSHSAVWSLVYLGLGSVAAAFGAFTAKTPLRRSRRSPAPGS